VGCTRAVFAVALLKNGGVMKAFMNPNIERLKVPSVTRDDAAQKDGVPPVVLLATQISTARWGNTVAYRSSGPIPRGLYRQILAGQAAPKPFTQKVKSSNWGVMEGYAVVDDKLGRSQANSAGNFEIRKHGENDLPRDANGNVTLNKFPLKMSLGDILAEATKDPPKYELQKENNPDENGTVYFRQINHSNPDVGNVTFSINLNDVNQEVSPKHNLELIASLHDIAQFQPENWRETLGQFADKLDYSFPCYAEFPGQSEPVPIEVYGEEYVTVRDTDLDFITQAMRVAEHFGAASSEVNTKIFETYDMASHDEDDEERALDATMDMVKLMLYINKMEWKNYEKILGEQQEKARVKGVNFDETLIADKRPLVDKMKDFDMVTKFAITVGMGTPMELYQAMEINIINQKTLALKEQHPGLNLDDFTNPIKRKEALLALNQVPLVEDDKMQARYFIQHPSECHNLHYTSDRGGSVIIHGAGIGLAKNDAEVIKFLNSNARNEHMTLNPEWMGDKPGANVNAKEWVKYYISHFDEDKDVNPKVNEAVSHYLLKNPEFVVDELKDFSGEKSRINNFLEKNPKIKEMIPEDENFTQRLRH
jgi:hypothetical protein